MSLTPSQVSSLKDIVALLQGNDQLVHSDDLAFFRAYLTGLGASLPAKKAAPVPAASTLNLEDDGLWEADPSGTPYVAIPAPDGTEEYQPEKEEAAQNLKQEGTELMQNGDYEAAIHKFTEALKLCPARAPYWAFRAQAYFKWKKPLAAVKDASEALRHNPENAKALRTRGMAHRRLGHYEEASVDLNAANRVDYDPDVLEMIKFVDEKAAKIRAHRRKEEIEKEEELAKTRAREAAAREAASARAREASAAPSGGMPSGMPGGMPNMGGMPGGMPGGVPPGMEQLFSDPEVMAALQDPDTAAKLQQIMANPMAAMQYMSDPKIAGLMQKMMGKMGGAGGMPGMGGMGGMPGMGGMGGMPGMGGMGGMPSQPAPQAPQPAAPKPAAPKPSNDELD